jgi:hypothetical protein
MAGQHIWNQGVVKNGMICLKKGVVEMLSDEDNESPMIAFTEGTVSCVLKTELKMKITF